MAHRQLKEKALALRREGYSYSHIKNELGVSKSTLSGWLRDMPLSDTQIRMLRAESPVRIERFQNTMRRKKQAKLDDSYSSIAARIGDISSRELSISGFFLYWAEGTKTRNGAIEMTNTNPYMLRYFLKWLELFAIQKHKIRVHLHLYSDMDVQKQIQFWSNILDISPAQFNKPYIKSNTAASITYSNSFGQGTCSLSVSDASLRHTMLMALKYLQNMVM